MSAPEPEAGVCVCPRLRRSRGFKEIRDLDDYSQRELCGHHLHLPLSSCTQRVSALPTRWHGRETADQMLPTDRPSARQREEIFGTVSAVTAVTSIFYTDRPTDRPTPRRKLRPYRARVPTLPSINIASHCQAATRPPRTAEAVRVCCRAHTVLSIRSLRCVTFGTYLGHVATKPPETA